MEVKRANEIDMPERVNADLIESDKVPQDSEIALSRVLFTGNLLPAESCLGVFVSTYDAMAASYRASKAAMLLVVK